MAEDSGISWTDNTFNPWMGCVRVSPGCEHCYAETLVTGRMKLPVWGPQSTTKRQRTAVANWRKPLAWDRAAAKAGTRTKVFCASLADVFEDNDQVAPWRLDLFALIEQTPHLDWQLLTKRPQNLRAMLPASWLRAPRHNVWLGTTVEDQRRALERVEHLCGVPAVVRFLSVEPQIEDVDLDPPICQYCGPSFVEDVRDGDPPWCLRCDSEAVYGHWLGAHDGINWVIVGGESGSGARAFDLDWARGIVRQCSERDVACFVKQLGARAIDSGRTDIVGADGRVHYVRPNDHPDVAEAAGTAGVSVQPHDVSRTLADQRHGGDIAEFPAELRVRQFPGAAS